MTSNPAKKICMKNFTYKKKIYIYEIAAADLSKIHFQTCKPNNRDLNRN